MDDLEDVAERTLRRRYGPLLLLRHVHDALPGLRRKSSAGGHRYLAADGTEVTDDATLERVAALAIPPAWVDVWISPEADTHLQATGVDARGRKQFLYHPEWRAERDALKFHDMEAFGRAQPALRRRVQETLGADGGLHHRRVLAGALRLLDVGLFRVGSDRYAHDNAHYGLTTLLRDQVRLDGERAVFDYVGKAGKRQRLAVSDPPAVAVVGSLRRRRSGPSELLAFRRPDGPWRRVHREDVNDFLRHESGGPFSAKEFRTWNATVIAARVLSEQRPAAGRAGPLAGREVAAVLGNTPAVARSSYIDPRVLQRYAAGEPLELGGLPGEPWKAREELERRVLALLAPDQTGDA